MYTLLNFQIFFELVKILHLIYTIDFFCQKNTYTIDIKILTFLSKKNM